MPSTQPASSLKPLCYEHHKEMRLNSKVSGNGTRPAQEAEYACQDFGCSVSYTSSAGYFIARREGSRAGDEILPHLRCANDGAPMYLGEVNPAASSFRLWKCPGCQATSINGQTVAAAD